MKFTNFSIEEILKPSFGLKDDSKPTTWDSVTDVPFYLSPDVHGAVVKLESLEEKLGGSLTFRGEEKEEKGTTVRAEMGGGRGGRTPGPPSPESAQLFPAWVYCTRYSDRPSAGPRTKRQPRRAESSEPRQRTSFSKEQIERLSEAFQSCPYLTEETRCSLSRDLKLQESQIKIWFQNKRAKSKKTSGRKTALAQNLWEQGLYNHVTRQDDC